MQFFYENIDSVIKCLAQLAPKQFLHLMNIIIFINAED